jgi:hypothetical protein
VKQASATRPLGGGLAGSIGRPSQTSFDVSGSWPSRGCGGANPGPASASASVTAWSQRDMAGLMWVSCVSQREGAVGSEATRLADCAKALASVAGLGGAAGLGGVKRGSRTKSSPKITLIAS